MSLPGLLLALAPGYFFAAVFWGVLSPALLVMGKHRQLLGWAACLTVLYALLSWKLTPHWGALGVAGAFSAVQLIFNPLLFGLYGTRQGRLRCSGSFVEMAVGAVFMCSLWLLCRKSLPATTLVASVYLVLWYARHASLLRSLRTVAHSFV